MLCSICKKRTAVVFISSGKTDAGTQALCIPCAKKLGIKPLENIVDNLDISEEELSNMQEQFSGIMDAGLDLEDDESEEEDDEGFSKGGAATFPLIKNLFSNMLFANKDDFSGDASKESEKSGKGNEKSKKKSKRRNLNLYCNNLTAKAKNGELDRIIGREKEINRAMQILCRRTKNNPCLIGEPGVGKTAIAEGLAIKIANDDVPFRLKGKEIYLLDLTALVAGTQFRGQFESRIKGLVDEIKKEGNIILFIDEVHNLVGTGDSEGTMNAANILKPALSRGEIQVIGATTFAEYRKHIEKDAALERRFQTIKIMEPSISQTIDVLKGIKGYYENHHRVKVSDELVRRLTVLSERYITDRFLPDKAIDLLDEACTYASLENKDLGIYDRLSSENSKLKAEEERILASGEEADYQKLAEIRCDIAKNDKKIESLSKKALGKEVTENDVAHVIELWTGIPSSKITENEFRKLDKLEEKLREKIIGQDQAVKEVAAAIRRNRVQISPRRRPASFIFVGPTGVGKTELVKVLAKELFDAPDSLIRLDMSEYMEKHSVSKIIGSPPGYVGYDEAGQLTEKIRRRPYSVILFDELEKAHPDVLNILLQILDDGRITDAQGRVVNFENTIIIMTSNAGSNQKGGSVGFGRSLTEQSKEKAMKALGEFLRPEFINRVDEIVCFNQLSEDNFRGIADIMLAELQQSLEGRGIAFTWDESVKDYLVKKSYSVAYGARNLRRAIQTDLEDPIAERIIKSYVDPFRSIKATCEDGTIKLEAI